jgi:hypothetical protein
MKNDGERQRKKELEKRRRSPELHSAWTDLDFSAAEGHANRKAHAVHLMVRDLVLRRRRLLSVWGRELRRLPSGR